jgi:hypothetical protein
MTTGEAQPGGDASAAPRRQRSPFVPMLLLATTVLGATAFQTLLLFTGRGALVKAITAQDPQMEQSKKVRTALESIATRTARVAKAGNANATVIVEELRKRGISINADSPGPAP